MRVARKRCQARGAWSERISTTAHARAAGGCGPWAALVGASGAAASSAESISEHRCAPHGSGTWTA